MSDTTTSQTPGTSDRILWCLIDGDAQPFKIKVASNKDIDDLKDVIHFKRHNSSFRDVDATDLVLWKVCQLVLDASVKLSLEARSFRRIQQLEEQIPNIPADVLPQLLRDFSTFAVRLNEPAVKVSAIFPQQPSKDDIHIVIQIPAGECSLSPVRMNNADDLFAISTSNPSPLSVISPVRLCRRRCCPCSISGNRERELQSQ
jgi:hypothetical protein